MTRLFPFAALLLTLTSPARADDMVIAQLWANSGSLPPQYAWNIEVTVSEAGRVTVKRCTGYETEGPACRTGEGAAVADSIDGIRRAAKASQLAERPAIAIDPPMVGGGWTTGTVIQDDRAIELIAQPIEDDKPRVNAVLASIFEAIPEDLLPILKDE